MISSQPAKAPTLAVIGCGAIADSLHLPALSRHREVLANLVLVDRDPERASALARKYGARGTATALGEVVDRLDGAVVAVPPRFHHPVALQCLERGVPVLCEKPLCEEPGPARELVARAAEGRVGLAVNQTRRLFPASREVRDRIAAGDLGPLRHIEFALGEPFDWPAATDSYFGVKGGGRGVLLDTGAHVVDLVCWWLGGTPRVVDYRDDSLGGTEAVADLVLEQAGCRAHVRLSWLSALANAYRIEGERGAIEGGVYERSSYTLHHPAHGAKKVRTAVRVRGSQDVANALIDNFLDVVAGRAEPLVPAGEVMPSLEVIDACYRRRRRLDLPWHEAWERIASA